MRRKFSRRKFLLSLAESTAALSLLTNARTAFAQKDKAFFREQDLFAAGANGYHTYRIPSIVATKKGALVTFCEARKNSVSDSGDIDLVFRRSEDNGETWSKQQILWNDNANTCGNPCAVVDRRSGTIHLLLTRNAGADHEAEIVDGTSRETRTVWHSQSVDDGKIWTKPREITNTTKLESWSWYATGPGAGVQLKNGRLIVPCDHTEKIIKANSSHVIYSDDNGATWRLGGTVPGGATNECEIVELANGELLLNARNADRNFKRRAVSISRDNGLTWSAIRRDENLIEPVCQASIRRYSLKNKSKNSRDLILFANPASEKRENLTVRASGDECKTWAYAKTVYAGKSAYSCLAVAPDNSIYCFYERGEESPYEKITLAKFNLAWLESRASI